MEAHRHRHRPSNQTEPWTNEKHLKFLNLMEVSFVHTMLENHCSCLPLDRYLPDSSDSTVDIKSTRCKQKAISEHRHGRPAGVPTPIFGEREMKLESPRPLQTSSCTLGSALTKYTNQAV